MWSSWMHSTPGWRSAPRPAASPCRHNTQTAHNTAHECTVRSGWCAGSRGGVCAVWHPLHAVRRGLDRPMHHGREPAVCVHRRNGCRCGSVKLHQTVRVWIETPLRHSHNCCTGQAHRTARYTQGSLRWLAVLWAGTPRSCSVWRQFWPVLCCVLRVTAHCPVLSWVPLVS